MKPQFVPKARGEGVTGGHKDAAPLALEVIIQESGPNVDEVRGDEARTK